jgi:phosphodiesterase/alkaline phosphatase D-like protein
MRKGILALALSFGMSAIGLAQNQMQITNGPTVEGVGDTWAVVAWTTNEGSSSVLHYGTDQNNLSQTAQQDYQKSQSSQGANHRVRMDNLQPGTTYYFKVDSGQGQQSGTTASSNVGQFTTNQAGQSSQNGQAASSGNLQISQIPSVPRIGDTWAVVTWTTNAGGSSVVHYGTDANNLSQTAQAPYAQGTNDTRHRVRITGLQPNTTYYFAVDSGQGQGTGTAAASTVRQFTTRPQGQQ